MKIFANLSTFNNNNNNFIGITSHHIRLQHTKEEKGNNTRYDDNKPLGR